jgi:hypothetical protein
VASRQAVRQPVNTLRAARAALADANVAMGRHYTMCARCGLAHGDTARFCDAGWELAKDQSRAAAAVRHITEAAELRPVQGMLW